MSGMSLLFIALLVLQNPDDARTMCGTVQSYVVSPACETVLIGGSGGSPTFTILIPPAARRHFDRPPQTTYLFQGVCATGLCGGSIVESMAAAPSAWTFNGTAQFNSFAPSAMLTAAAVNHQRGTTIYKHPLVVDGFEFVGGIRQILVFGIDLFLFFFVVHSVLRTVKDVEWLLRVVATLVKDDRGEESVYKNMTTFLIEKDAQFAQAGLFDRVRGHGRPLYA